MKGKRVRRLKKLRLENYEEECGWEIYLEIGMDSCDEKQMIEEVKMTLKNEVHNSWEWLRRRDLEPLEKKFLLCYGTLLLLEKKEWKHFSFNNPFGMFLS
uniref:hypothetical protein n=1 Tax=Bacillus thuringiensis TaxID=1428 RepID=UPI00119E9A29